MPVQVLTPKQIAQYGVLGVKGRKPTFSPKIVFLVLKSAQKACCLGAITWFIGLSFAK